MNRGKLTDVFSLNQDTAKETGMTESTSRTILVLGATGAMGRPIVSRLLADQNNNWRIRAFTRDPESPSAQKLLTTGADSDRVELFKGDLNDPASVEVAMKGVYGVFCNTNFFERCSVEHEYEQGVRFLEAAKFAGVQHFIYSSLDNMTALSQGRFPCPHFDAKAAVEGYINRRHSDEFMRQEADGWYSRHVTVLVTLPYFENLTGFFLPRHGALGDGREGLIFWMPTADKPYPFVALGDIAWFTTHIFANLKEWGGRTLAIGGERLTIAELAATFERVTGIPAEHQPMTLEEFQSLGIPNSHDVANQFRFHREYGPYRDYDALRKINSNLMNFETWLRHSGWRGEEREVQKGGPTGKAE
jgi:nucleoside-diphosphate-sugar epimerase